MNENKIELNKSKFYEYFQDLTDIWVFNNKKREERNQFKSKLQTFIIKSKVYLKKKRHFSKGAVRLLLQCSKNQAKYFFD